MMQRRTFLQAVGVGAAAGLVSPVAIADRAAVSASSEQAAPRSIVGDLAASPDLGQGWRVAEVSPVQHGAITVSLVGAAGEVDVQLFRRSRVSAGLVQTHLLDLRVMNGADGATPTQEGLGLAVMSLATRIRGHERAALRGGLCPEHRAALRSLRTHERRLSELGGYAQGPEGERGEGAA